MFLVAPDDGEGRLRDLIRLSFLLFFCPLAPLLLYFSRFFSCVVFFMCDCIRLLLFANIGGSSSSRFFYVLLFFFSSLLRKLRTRKKHVRYSIAINVEGKKTTTDSVLYQVSFITLVVVEKIVFCF